jgi:hypothetical protein
MDKGSEKKYVYPTPSIPPSDSSDSELVLTKDQVESWRERGFCLVDGIFPPFLLSAVCDIAHEQYPDNGCVVQAEFGATTEESRSMIFPTLPEGKTKLNEIPLNTRLINACHQLLLTKDIRLCQSELWHKRGTAQQAYDRDENTDQRIHIDAWNHYITAPPQWDAPEAVSIIVYYDDHDKKGGETAVVPRKGPLDAAYHIIDGDENPLLLTPGGRSDLPWFNDRTYVEKWFEEKHPYIHKFRQGLYEREAKAAYKTGTVLFYRMDTWHRGTPLFEGQVRRTHNLVYKKADCEWHNSWNAGCAKDMYTRRQVVERMLCKCTENQRNVLGYPPASSSYWTAYTKALTDQRYAALRKKIAEEESSSETTD